MAAKSTNVTLSWKETPAAPNTTLYWGNTSSYKFTDPINGSGTYSAFLDYLQPNITYYYEIEAIEPSPGCTGTYYSTNSSSSTWTTQSESVYMQAHGYWINGTVYDAQHTTETAPANTIVEA
ncbi:MAG TPA: hypothetical protein VEH57_02160, partial [Thermoplasmata archaeon]|nr:hypothetical protein [Thermoplasmata archaeon]